jgi:hypothetical protein
MNRTHPILLFLCSVAGLLAQEGGPVVDYAAMRSHYRSTLGDQVGLLRFAIIGTLRIADRDYIAVETMSVVEGMVSPRGRSEIVVCDVGGRPLLSLPIGPMAYREPLFCQGSKLVLHGRTTGIPALTQGRLTNGNVVDFALGLGDHRMVDEVVYGSSGGVADGIPGEAERAAERRDWDAK